jgi:hypothetical protein
MFTRVQGTNPELPTETHPEIELLWEYTYNYPFAEGSDWIPIGNLFSRLNLDEKIANHLLEQAGLKNEEGWDEKFEMFGLLMQSKIVEKDPTTGYHGLIDITLVSAHGCRFFEEFFKL